MLGKSECVAVVVVVVVLVVVFQGSADSTHSREKREIKPTNKETDTQETEKLSDRQTKRQFLMA